MRRSYGCICSSEEMMLNAPSKGRRSHNRKRVSTLFLLFPSSSSVGHKLLGATGHASFISDGGCIIQSSPLGSFVCLQRRIRNNFRQKGKKFVDRSRLWPNLCLCDG